MWEEVGSWVDSLGTQHCGRCLILVKEQGSPVETSKIGAIRSRDVRH